MADLNEHVLEEAQRRGERLLVRELVQLIERHHPDDEAGIPRDVIAEYVSALPTDGERMAAAETITAEIDERLTDSETWVGDGALYRVGPDRISAYPARWHEELGETTDLREFIDVVQSDTGGEGQDLPEGATGEGVARSRLIDVATVISEMDQEKAEEQIDRLRDADRIEADADQHPDARLRRK